MTLLQVLTPYRVVIVGRTIRFGSTVSVSKEHLMELRKLVTITFDKNVGTADRIVRLAAGAALAGAGWYFGLPTGASVGMTILGAMTMATGVLSKCSIYYLLGYSTCPISGQASPFKRPAG